MEKALLRLLEEAVIDRAVLDKILEEHGLAEKLRRIEKGFREE